MKAHALDMYEAIQCGDFVAYGKLVGKTWEQNKALDSGTNPAAVEAIISKIQAYALGYKLPGRRWWLLIYRSERPGCGPANPKDINSFSTQFERPVRGDELVE